MALVHTRAMLKRTTIWLTREQIKRLQPVAKRKGAESRAVDSALRGRRIEQGEKVEAE
jgi:hypothetical protein